MSSIEVKTFDKADEVVDKFNRAKIEAVKVGGQRVVRLHLKPGWKWSTDVKPHVGTDSCQANHIGIITKGTVFAKHDDGTEVNAREAAGIKTIYVGNEIENTNKVHIVMETPAADTMQKFMQDPENARVIEQSGHKQETTVMSVCSD